MNPEGSFWPQLAAAHAAGRPTVWRRPFGAPVVSCDEVFQWLVRGTRAAKRTIGLRVYGEHGQEAKADWHHPIADDGSMAGYLARLGNTLGGCGVVVNDFQAACPDAWRRTQGLLGRVFAELGLPAGGASFEIFSGAYRRGAFGVHKDDQDVITFVLEGKKRFRLWPFERFADRPEVPPGCRERPFALKLLDERAHRHDSIVLEGEPGDVFFWPAEWWHVAESDGDQCTTVGLGLFRGVSSHRFVEEAVRAVGVEAPARLPFGAAVPVMRGVLDQVVSHAELAAKLEERVLAFTSAFGCRAVPAPLDPDAVPRTIAMRAPIAAAVPWSISDDAIAWAVAGQVFRYPAVRAIVTLFERVASGEVFVVDRLAGELADEEVEADALVHILSVMYAHHALVPA